MTGGELLELLGRINPREGKGGWCAGGYMLFNAKFGVYAVGCCLGVAWVLHSPWRTCTAPVLQVHLGLSFAGTVHRTGPTALSLFKMQ